MQSLQRQGYGEGGAGSGSTSRRPGTISSKMLHVAGKACSVKVTGKVTARGVGRGVDAQWQVPQRAQDRVCDGCSLSAPALASTAAALMGAVWRSLLRAHT